MISSLNRYRLRVAALSLLALLGGCAGTSHPDFA